jgi:phenylalanine-4-hydroxylase
MDRLATSPSDDWTVPQDWTAYTPAEHRVWDALFARQSDLLVGRAVPAFLRGLEVLHLSKPGVPDFNELSDRLTKLTGWSVVAVPGLVPDEVFFEHLANRRFVAGRFIRRPDQMDYLEEPDVFHDVFGHVPLLSDPVFSDYMQAYGEGGLRAARLGATPRLARLYWHTVEFGLIRGDEGLRIYGAGIVSSKGESLYALESPAPPRIAFDMPRVMRTRYKIDDYQSAYFVIDSFEGLLKQTLETDFAPLYRDLAATPDIEPGAVTATDKLMPLGTDR